MFKSWVWGFETSFFERKVVDLGVWVSNGVGFFVCWLKTWKNMLKLRFLAKSPTLITTHKHNNTSTLLTLSDSIHISSSSLSNLIWGETMVICSDVEYHCLKTPIKSLLLTLRFICSISPLVTHQSTFSKRSALISTLVYDNIDN